MMSEPNTRKQDGDESFDLTEWLTNDVKLPQYRDVLLEHGFELPIECSSIDESVLDKLGVVKIGHRKRLLVSCQKLADKWGLSSQDLAKSEKNSDASSEARERQTISNVDFQSPGNLELPPLLPPKKGKKPRPSPPPRNMAEQEVNNDNAIIEVEGNPNVSGDSHDELDFDVYKPGTSDSQITEVKPIERTSNGGGTVHESTNIETSTILSPDEAYEPLWMAMEGEPLPKSPPSSETHITDNIDAIDKNANLDIHSAGKININNEEGSNQHNKELEEPDCSSAAPSGPPPIPPRSDLGNDVCQETKYDISGSGAADTVAATPTPTNVCESKSSDTITTQEKVQPPRKKTPPVKPPRRNKPVSMFFPPKEQQEFEPRRSVGSMDQSGKSDVIYENRVTPDPTAEHVQKRPQNADEKRSVFDRVPTSDVQGNTTDANLYDNAESFQKAPLKHTMSGPEFLGPEKNKKPKPVPRSRTLSDNKCKPDKEEQDYVYDVVADPGNDGGSCTEDDLSGSDGEEMPERNASVSSTLYEEVDKTSAMHNAYETPGVPSQYETVKLPRPTSVIQTRHSTKEGYLYKQGGQQNNKGWKRRWVVFDGNQLCYFKDKEHTHETLQRVGVAIMQEVRIVTEDTKRARFDLKCAGRTYMFALGIEQMDVIQLWAQILMSSIIQVRKEDETNVSQNPGGDMFEPDKKGFLKKQGNSVVADWKKRYVAVKDGMFAYYHNFEDFLVASPINTIHMNLASVKVDPKSPNRLQLVTPHRTYIFQCDEEGELRSWVAALEKAIQLALGDRTVINNVWKNRSNRWCADCGERDPLWASINLVVCVCARCIGVHRNLGVHSSKPRSLLMDEKVWSPNLIRLMVEVGNEKSNQFWQYRIPDDDRISPASSSEARKEFIRRKYVQRMYRHVSHLYGDPVQLGEALKCSVRTDDVEKTMQLVFCGADVQYVSSDGSETRTPYELAEDAKQELQMEFLMQNGAINIEPEPVHTPDPLTDNDRTYETVYEITNSNQPAIATSTIPIVYEKEGFLQKKAPSAAVWRRRYFMLKGRELWYDKGDKDGHGLIKLKDVEEYVYNDSVALDIVTAERTYNLKAETKEEAFVWYTALRNKQVFHVPLECQELGSDGIPHLVAKSLQFVETHGLDAEGIYRKNGNKTKIKILKKLFNQDAESVMIFREDYEAHDVAGLLKEYFRELPDPLMTVDAYAHFITASLTPDHNEKLNMYKNSLGRLPEVNRTTLKAVINHLVRVSSHSQQNKMKLENISLIFGPTLMSNAQMGAMDTNTINQEFTVIGDFITYYKWLFDVGDDEMLKDQKIAEAMDKLQKIYSKSDMNECRLNELTLDIYAFSAENECSRITVLSDTTASKICQELTSKRAMPPDLNWALFESVNGEIERPFPALEKVLDTVIETGKYTQLSKSSRLVVKENYVEEKLKALALQNDTSLSIAGSCQTMKETKKKDWKRLFIKLEKGNLTVHKSAKSKDEVDSWPVSETTLYIGVDREKKPITGIGFTIVRIAKDGQDLYRYICLDDERELYRWINLFLKLKYPQTTNLWTDPTLEPIGYYAEALQTVKPPVPRQRTPTNKMGGATVNMLNELKEKQLRKSVRR